MRSVVIDPVTQPHRKNGNGDVGCSLLATVPVPTVRRREKKKVWSGNLQVLPPNTPQVKWWQSRQSLHDKARRDNDPACWQTTVWVQLLLFFFFMSISIKFDGGDHNNRRSWLLSRKDSFFSWRPEAVVLRCCCHTWRLRFGDCGFFLMKSWVVEFEWEECWIWLLGELCW